MPVKTLCTASAVIEAGAGVALMAVPSVLAKLLFGSPLDAPVAVMTGRLAGAALFTLAVGCWLARSDARSRAARGLVAAMLFYNIAAVAVFLFAAFGPKLIGIALWPAVILHAAMAGWSVVSLAKKNGAGMK